MAKKRSADSQPAPVKKQSQSKPTTRTKTPYTYVAFLRAINVGCRFVKMEVLRELFESMEFESVRTFLNSGNVLFESHKKFTAKLVASVEDELEKLLGYKSEVFVRTPEQVMQIADRCAGLLTRVSDTGDVNVAFLQQPLTGKMKEAIALLENDFDAFELDECEVYWISRTRQSESKFSNALFERKLSTRSTFRKASMLQKLSALLQV